MALAGDWLPGGLLLDSLLVRLGANSGDTILVFPRLKSRAARLRFTHDPYCSAYAATEGRQRPVEKAVNRCHLEH